MKPDLEAAVAAIWERSKPELRENLGLVEAASTALAAGTLEEHVRHEGHRAAHQLSGSLGMFGHPEASELAAEIEHELGTTLDAQRTRALSERLSALIRPRLA